MKTTYPFIVNCFCGPSDSSGNPAAVYIDLVSNGEEKQNIANELNLPVSVFVTDSQAQLPKIEYFYPNKKMPLCLHGTLAAAYIFFKKYARMDGAFLTSNGKMLKYRQCRNNYFSIEVFAEKISLPCMPLSLLAKFFNNDVAGALKNVSLTIASVGSPKLLISVPANILPELRPNYSEIEQWSIKNKVNGLYVHSHHLVEPNVFLARGFNPIGGHNEDAATGVAVGALSLALEKSLIVEQGHALGEPCRIAVDYKSLGSIWVGGKVR